MSTTNRPLWEIISDAYFEGRSARMQTANDEGGYAAEIRAIAHEILTRGLEGGVTGPVAQWLLDEADRAEAGEIEECAEVPEPYWRGITYLQRQSSDARIRRQILAIANELKRDLANECPERPSRLVQGDVWRFEADAKVNGKLKPTLTEWEVIGWHAAQHAWELRSLDGCHKTYLMEYAPTYEEMEYLGRGQR